MPSERTEMLTLSNQCLTELRHCDAERGKRAQQLPSREMMNPGLLN